MVEVIITDLKGWNIDGKQHRQGDKTTISEGLLKQFPDSFKPTEDIELNSIGTVIEPKKKEKNVQDSK